MVEVLRGRENARRRTRPPGPSRPRTSTLRRGPGDARDPLAPAGPRVSHPERVGRLRGVGRDRSGRPHGGLPAAEALPHAGPRGRAAAAAPAAQVAFREVARGASPRTERPRIRVASLAAPPRALRGPRVRGGRRAYLGHPAAAAVPGLPARVPVPSPCVRPQLGGRLALIQAPAVGACRAKWAALRPAAPRGGRPCPPRTACPHARPCAPGALPLSLPLPPGRRVARGSGAAAAPPGSRLSAGGGPRTR